MGYPKKLNIFILPYYIIMIIISLPIGNMVLTVTLYTLSQITHYQCTLLYAVAFEDCLRQFQIRILNTF